MGWPNHNLEGWDEVTRNAVEEWLQGEYHTFTGEVLHPSDEITALVDMLQAEHSKIFSLMLDAVPVNTVLNNESDYLSSLYAF